MKSVHRTVSTDEPIKFSLGLTLGLGALALAPLAVGVGLLTIRHYSMRDMEAAKNWVETPCVIEKCEWVTHDDGRSLDLVYRYEFDGQSYQGDELDTIIGSMGDDDVFEEHVHETYPPGAQATCYVDPNNPSKSVFDRDHGADAPRRMWLLAFPFTCVGLGFSLALITAFVGGLRNARPDPPPLELTTSPGPPPRNIPLATRLVVLAGPMSSQIAWLFVVAFTFVFVIMDGPASFGRFIDIWPNELTVTGRITDVRKEAGHELGQTVYQYIISYEVDGQTYTNSSYTRGKKHEKGGEVTIKYEPAAPDKGTIAGARSSSIPMWVSAIPLGVVLLLAYGIIGMFVHSVRALRLLRSGQVTTAGWMAPMLTQASLKNDSGDAGDSDEIPSMLSDFYFEVGGISYQAKKYCPQSKLKSRPKSTSRNQKDTPPDEKVTVLYNPNNPNRNVILNGGLAEMINHCRTTGQRIMHCAPAPLAITVLAILFHYARAI